VIPELEEEQVDNLTILKATSLKFVYTFRNQVPDEFILQFIGVFSNFLKSQSPVNQSYAAACIEKMLIKKNK
jgi:hypothetical protein